MEMVRASIKQVGTVSRQTKQIPDAQESQSTETVSAKSLQLCPTLCDPMDWNPGSSGPWDSPGKNTGVGSHSFLQGIFPTQGLNPGLL